MNNNNISICMSEELNNNNNDYRKNELGNKKKINYTKHKSNYSIAGDFKKK